MKKYSQGKKLISFALVFALLISLFSIMPLTASAKVGDTEVVDGVTYTVSSEVYGEYTASVTALDGSTTDVVIKDQVNINGTDFKVTVIDKAAFGGNTKITSVSIPGTVIEVASGTFNGCSGLTTVTLNEGIQTISGSAFKNCTSLLEIKFPKSLVSVANQAFMGCTSIKNIYIYSDVKFAASFYDCTGIEHVYCYSRDIKFDSRMFDGANQNLIIHGYADSTAETFAALTNAFKKKAFKFEEIKEEETTTEEATTEAPTESDDTIFTWKKVNEGDGLDGPIEITGLKEGKSATRDFEIPSVINAHPVTVIGESAFAKNTNIANLTIPSSVIVINNKAFYDITYLSSVTFAENSQIQKIGDEAFAISTIQGLDKMSEIDLPESLKQIGYMAFNYRVNLAMVRVYSKDVSFGTPGKGAEVFGTGEKTSTLKLYGYSESTTQTYAKENGHTFRYLDLNTDELQKVYDEAEAIDSSLYTADSYAELTTAMKAAKRLLGTAGRDATPAQIDEAIAAVKAAIEGLVPIGAETTAPVETTVTPETTIVIETTEATTAPVDKIEVLLGDADGSGKVDVKDVTHIQKHIASYFTLEGTAALAADVDGNGTIDVNDATLVQKYLAAYNVDYKIGEVVQFGSDAPQPTEGPEPTATEAPQPTNEPEPTTAEPEPTDSVEPSAPDGTTIFYIPNYVSWLDDDGGKLWLYNDDTDAKIAAVEYDTNEGGISGYFYFYLPNDWVNISIYRTPFDTTEETFDKNKPWDEATQTGIILNKWEHIGDRGENNAYKIIADGAPGVFETFDPKAPKPDEDERTIYFDNSKTMWTTVYIYGWSFGLEKEFIPLESEGNNIWSYTFYDTLPIDGVTGFLFVNQTDWTGAIQTGDLATTEGKNLFVPSGSGVAGVKLSGTWDVYNP